MVVDDRTIEAIQKLMVEVLEAAFVKVEQALLVVVAYGREEALDEERESLEVVPQAAIGIQVDDFTAEEEVATRRQLMDRLDQTVQIVVGRQDFGFLPLN